MLKTFVITRSGNKEKVSFDKILERLEFLAGDDLEVNPFEIAQKTIEGLHNDITTRELDMLSADISATKTQLHPDYNKFASRIAVSNLHKQTCPSYIEVVKAQHKAGRISNKYYEFVMAHGEELEKMIDFKRDYNFDYFGFKTLERSYLDKIGDTIVERPQYAFMRVAVQIHGLHSENLETSEKLALIKETYDSMSNLEFTHASPTIFNAGTNNSQLSSCFLLHCGDDLGQIFDTIKDSAMISKWAGGIGISISDVRAKGTRISGTGGTSNGIVDLCKTFNQVARYINQGGRRKGSIARYLPMVAKHFSKLKGA
jgi:ribonucleoside-diphosphate reductase alpha chain